jgi:hypothetical protein
VRAPWLLAVGAWARSARRPRSRSSSLRRASAKPTDIGLHRHDRTALDELLLRAAKVRCVARCRPMLRAGVPARPCAVRQQHGSTHQRHDDGAAPLGHHRRLGCTFLCQAASRAAPRGCCLCASRARFGQGSAAMSSAKPLPASSTSQSSSTGDSSTSGGAQTMLTDPQSGERRFLQLPLFERRTIRSSRTDEFPKRLEDFHDC